VLSGASTREAETWIGTLADLAAGVESRDTDAPGTIVIGEVVRIGAMLATELDRATNDDEDEPVSESIGAGR
jgi:siroheme synthase